jgi:hypothetical protein
MSEAAAQIDETKKPRIYLHTVEIDITDEEAGARTKHLLDVLNKIDTIEADKQSRMSDFNSELKQLRKEAAKVRQAIKIGKERRDIEVYDVPEEKQNTIHIMRASDGKKVDERAMTLEDRMHAGKSKAEAEKAQKATESPAEQAAANDSGKPPGKADAAGKVTRIKASDVKKKQAQRDAKAAADKARAAADANDAKNSDDGNDGESESA